MAFATILPSAAPSPSAHAPVAPAETGGVTCRATSPPSRNATSKASSPDSTQRARRAEPLPGGKCEPVGPGRDPLQSAGQGDDCRRQARRAGKIQARAASVRRLRQAEAAGGNEPRRPSPPTISAGAITACFTSPPRKTLYVPASIPNGILKHWQFAGLADLTERCGGPYSHVTTRANLQIREIPPKHAVEVVEGIESLGLWSRGPPPTTSATSPARRRPVSILRRFSTRAPMRASGTSTSSTTARFTACRASSMWASTAAASFRCWRTPTTSAFRRSR